MTASTTRASAEQALDDIAYRLLLRLLASRLPFAVALQLAVATDCYGPVGAALTQAAQQAARARRTGAVT